MKYFWLAFALALIIGGIVLAMGGKTAYAAYFMALGAINYTTYVGMELREKKCCGKILAVRNGGSFILPVKQPHLCRLPLPDRTAKA
jgi:hypothetical protein